VERSGYISFGSYPRLPLLHLPPPEVPVMRFFDRREFIHSSTALAAAMAALKLSATRAHAEEKSKVVARESAQDRLRVAVMGVNGRGMSHVHAFAGQRNCLVATICDADAGVIGPAMSHCLSKQGFLPRFEADIRKVLEDKSIDVVTIATPNHWHALAAIWAMQAGKDATSANNLSRS